MWCKHCRKHVAHAIPGGDDGAAWRDVASGAVCPDCGQSAGSDPPAVAEDCLPEFSLADDPALPSATSRLHVAPFEFDSWELDQDLLDAERAMAHRRREQQKLAEAAAAKTAQAKATREATRRRLPAGLRHDYGTIEMLTAGMAHGEVHESLPEANAADCRDTFLAWMLRAAGLMLLAFGGVLLAWSWVALRADLGSLGLPVALAGLAALVVGHLLRPRPTAPRAAPPVVPLPYATWPPPSYPLPAFFPPQPGYASADLDTSESRRMLAQMKSQLDELAARLEK